MKVKVIVILIVFLIFSTHQLGYAWGWRPRPPAPPAPPAAPAAPPASGSSGKAPLPGSVVVVVVMSGVLLLELWRRKRNEDSD